MSETPAPPGYSVPSCSPGSRDLTRSDVLALILSFNPVSRSDVEDLSRRLSSLQSSYDALFEEVLRLRVRMDMIYNSLSKSLSDLGDRVAKLERETSHIKTVRAPLHVTDGELAILAKPSFCTLDPVLSGTSLNAVFATGSWLAKIEAGASIASFILNLRFHHFGQRTTLFLSSPNVVTVFPGSSVYLVLDTSRLIDPTYDTSPLTPSPAFAANMFMVDMVFDDASTKESFSLSTTGSFSHSAFRIAWIPVASETKNYFIRAVRFSIATI
uniref:Sigma C protein n=1 Tax=Muscovy duck reovirus TaxID=77153 RepID=Q0ZBB7_9REOV|nr:sigma C protein [Muscovy duck reovirus]